MKMRAKPIIYSVPSNAPQRSRSFYSDLLGVELTRSSTRAYESYNAPISQDGIDITVNQRHTQHDTPMVYFAVDDLEKALAEAKRLGATVVWGPEDLHTDPVAVERSADPSRRESPGAQESQNVGRAAVLVDPGGSQVGLMQLDPSIHGHFRYEMSHKAGRS